MLDVREVDGVQLFKLKNPWAHLRQGWFLMLNDNHNVQQVERQLVGVGHGSLDSLLPESP